MAARKGHQLTDSWKEKIKIGVIIDRLSKHITGDLEMTPTQINAAKILLSKVTPDLKSVESKAEVTHNYVMRLPDVAQDAEQWQQNNPQVTIQ